MQTNFGILDQRLAIDWTHKYISYFGGDPEKITIVGCSAGRGSKNLKFSKKRVPTFMSH